MTTVDFSICLTLSSSDQSLGYFVPKTEGHCHRTQLPQGFYIFKAMQRGWGCHFAFNFVPLLENDATLLLIYVFYFCFGNTVVILKNNAKNVLLLHMGIQVILCLIKALLTHPTYPTSWIITPSLSPFLP